VAAGKFNASALLKDLTAAAAASIGKDEAVRSWIGLAPVHILHQVNQMTTRVITSIQHHVQCAMQ
jgi:hypothetical protein